MPSLGAVIKLDPDPNTAEELYLDLMKRTLTRALVAREFDRHTFSPYKTLYRSLYRHIGRLLAVRGLELVRVRRSDMQDYLESGHEATNRVEDAETMIGTRQLDNLQFCITDVLRREVPGDLLEAGVWRGGASIFMRAVLKAHGDRTRCVWLADSFAGLPPMNKAMEISYEWKAGDMAVSLEQVKENFARYGLLDSQVRFLKGFFADTLPLAEIKTLSVLRVDADLFESTNDVLTQLYPKLSIGGYAVFDDYHNLPDCRQAIDLYREKHGITDEIRDIDRRAVYWRKERNGTGFFGSTTSEC
jgi:O-methyltransferase